MRKLLLLALLTTAATGAMAQAAGPAGAPPKSSESGKHAKIDRKEMAKINQEIFDKLGLSDDQKAKLKTHREEMAAKLKELRKGAKGANKSEDLKEKVKSLRKEDQAFLKQTLTKTQMREFQKLRREKIKELTAKKAPAKP